MHTGAGNGRSDPLQSIVGAGTLLLGLLCAFGAWWEITGRDGLLLVIVPAAAMPVLAASLARRAVRKKRP